MAAMIRLVEGLAPPARFSRPFAAVHAGFMAAHVLRRASLANEAQTRFEGILT